MANFKYLYTENGVAHYAGLPGDTRPKSPVVGTLAHLTDGSGNTEAFNGIGWTQISTNGAGHVHIKADDVFTVTGDMVYSPLLGASGSLVALPSGSGNGPDTYVVDLSQFNSASIYLVVITETGTVTHTAKVKYSNDGGASYQHPKTADDLWSETAGNLEALVPKKDKFAHITLEQITGTVEDVWAYLIGREVA